MAGEKRTIRLCLIAPDREAVRIECESARFSIPDGEENRKAGGSVGIRPGHEDALMAVAPGTVSGFSGGEKIFSCVVGAGLAVITGEEVSILTDRIGPEA